MIWNGNERNELFVQPELIWNVLGMADIVTAPCTLTVIGSLPMQLTKTYEYFYFFCGRVAFLVMGV